MRAATSVWESPISVRRARRGRRRGRAAVGHLLEAREHRVVAPLGAARRVVTQCGPASRRWYLIIEISSMT